jgi:uncharacterized protein with von Willebrand factor type A (vWA) domain
MLDAVDGLVRQLREVGIPVALSETIDAVRTLDHIDLSRRSELKVALRSALIKNTEHVQTFDTIFELFFSLRPASSADPDDPSEGYVPDPTGSGPGNGTALHELEDEVLRELLLKAMRTQDTHMMKIIAGAAVERHAHIEPGRPVAGTYYLYRTLRAMKPDQLLDTLVTEADAPGMGGLERQLLVERAEAQVQRFREEVEAEIRRRLVADRGSEAVARTLRAPLPEDVTFLTASRVQVAEMRTILEPLTRTLATKLSRKRRSKRQGALDFRKTVRRSMSTGGVPAEPVFRKPRPSKPQLIVLADISGSVATFAAFTLQLAYALRQEFSSVRCFVFVDGVDEVTDVIAGARDIVDATSQINADGSGVWLDGRSDYGHALESFWDNYGGQVNSRSTVVVLGDARSNYHSPQAETLGRIQRSASRLYWLNPEAPNSWDTGDSVIGKYAPYCDAVFQCRNVRQLKAFVEQLE